MHLTTTTTFLVYYAVNLVVTSPPRCVSGLSLSQQKMFTGTITQGQIEAEAEREEEDQVEKEEADRELVQMGEGAMQQSEGGGGRGEGYISGDSIGEEALELMQTQMEGEETPTEDPLGIIPQIS